MCIIATHTCCVDMYHWTDICHLTPQEIRYINNIVEREERGREGEREGERGREKGRDRGREGERGTSCSSECIICALE